jgi:MFS family permease
LGGPIGGYLADTIGWRWFVSIERYSTPFIILTDMPFRSFLGQCPPTILALGLVAWKLHIPSFQEEQKQSQWSKLRRVDFLGAILLSISIVCGLLVLDFGAQRMPWTHPTVLALFGASLVSGNLFFIVEAFWAKEPIFPLGLLLNRDVVTSYINLGFTSGSQIAVSIRKLLLCALGSNILVR